MKQIPLTQGKIALVDDEDYAKVLAAGPWHASQYRSGRWYAERKIRLSGKQTTQRMHRFIMGLEQGDPTEVDHVALDAESGLDNRRSNLRIATRSQNNRNIGLLNHNTSGFKGVHWHKRDKKWRASISVGGIKKHLGYHPNPAVAALVYDQAALKHHGEFAVTNSSLGLLQTAA